MNPKNLIDAFQKESDCWKQMLESIIKENINLKMHLAHILNDPIEHQEYIEMAEAYQTRFIQNDVIIGLIRKDIVEFQSSLSAQTYEHFLPKGIVDRKAELQREIISLQVAFNELRHHFNKNIPWDGI